MGKSVDLRVKIGNLSLKNPFLVGSGPTVRDLDQIKAAADSGWAGASVKLAIEPFPYLNFNPRYRWLKQDKIHIFTAEKRLTAKEGLKVVEQARNQISDDFLLIPTITYDGEDYEGWGKLAKQFEDAGAQAIELNMCCPNMSYNLSSTGESTKKSTGASLGNDLACLPIAVKCVTDAVGVPVIVKFSAENPHLPASAYAALTNGAAAVGHNGNWLGIPDIDIKNPDKSIYRLQDQITLGCMSGPFVRPLAMRDTYQLRRGLGPDAVIIGSGGVSNLQTAVQHLMVGASALWICTETMIRGFDWMPKMLEDLVVYMNEMGYESINDISSRLLKNIASANELTVHDGYAYIDPEKCINCGICWKIGHCNAIDHDDKTSYVNKDLCLACSTCVDLCPKKAISMVQTN
ncbi:MAG: 4Fe-4S binding protein [Sphaerochaetaceae bacterium]|jgi:dihydroorotate dehydrogenase/Pyruvate/2-oxoacid:ferredoxin oxidoreductase delta subunit|nr:4Fe-4S binding protein [Sphaerochaetaceae bacterium]MDD3671372.1 4Fe-4S binding protein [Sphaerochaetaceae bacterium]MDX9933429.1 4Fe-4S binding protein [Sphaerochaetaceae bacterium]